MTTATFYCVRAKKDYGAPGQWGHFPKGAYMTKKEMRAGFATARLFPTRGKASQNAKVNSYMPEVADQFDEWFEIVPVEVQEPA